jgi:hypothetical protein
VHAIERLGLSGREMQALLRDDAQSGVLEPGVDLAREVAARGVGLEDGKVW